MSISVDTLTYIYENTFVSPESRQKLGIYSTPSYVADYVMSQIPIIKAALQAEAFMPFGHEQKR